ncbi:MAG: HAD family hydrolase, partial [Verrucomicrobia bacterium]|nr:HAD family hydrolase [Verrucomicrobiota bacterium]
MGRFDSLQSGNHARKILTMSSESTYSADALRKFCPTHDAFIGIDSDGCVFDTMEIKQKQCFHGLIVSTWGLEAIDREVRETAAFVNLYSRWRGQNRFTALQQTFALLAERPEVRNSGIRLPDFTAFNAFVASGAILGNDALRAAAERTSDPTLFTLLAWSLAVNEQIEAKVKRIAPFPWAARSLEKIQGCADAVVVSQTPLNALVREWKENGILDRVSFIAGQEIGTKAEHLQMATQGKYKKQRVLMIGDAAGDRDAAETCGACFYPI